MILTCMLSVKVTVSHSTQARVGLVQLGTRVMAQFGPRIGVALSGLDALPPAWLILIIRVIFLVLYSEPLGLFYKWTLLVFAQ